MAEILEVIELIFGLIETVKTISELAGGHAKTVITIDDLKSLMEGADARFFTTVALADVQTAHNNFHNVWLPTITSLTTITQHDVNDPSGRLYQVLQDLVAARNKLDYNLGRLTAVYHSHGSALHIDEITRGHYAISIHGYTLLLHMQAVYAELHRIQVGVSSLDDPALVGDTHAVLQYLSDAKSIHMYFKQAGWFGNIGNRRLSLVSDVQVYTGSIHPVFYFTDGYTPLSSTPSELILSGPFKPEPSEDSEKIVSAHASYDNSLAFKLIDKIIDVRDELDALEMSMRDRLKKQGGGGMALPRRRRHPDTIEKYATLAFGRGNDDDYEDYPPVPEPVTKSATQATPSSDK